MGCHRFPCCPGGGQRRLVRGEQVSTPFVDLQGNTGEPCAQTNQKHRSGEMTDNPSKVVNWLQTPDSILSADTVQTGPKLSARITNRVERRRSHSTASFRLIVIPFQRRLQDNRLGDNCGILLCVCAGRSKAWRPLNGRDKASRRGFKIKIEGRSLLQLFVALQLTSQRGWT